MRAAALALVALCRVAIAVAGDADVTLPKLGGDVQSAPPAGGDQPAKTLPRTVAVCQDAAATRCWLAPDARACGGEPFRVVIDAGGTDADTALADCRRQFAAGRTP